MGVLSSLLTYSTHSFASCGVPLPTLTANLDALEQLRVIGFKGGIAATARYPDEEAQLRDAGATAVFNIYAEAGTGFADLVAASHSES